MQTHPDGCTAKHMIDDSGSFDSGEVRMERKSNGIRGVRAIALIVMAASAIAVAPTAIAVDCPNTNASGGFGGQDSYCTYSCSISSYVHIRVESADPDADVKGSTRCADQSAACGWDLEICEGESERATTTADFEAICEGHSDETVRSPLTVDCWTTSDPCGPLGCLGFSTGYTTLIHIEIDENGASASYCVSNGAFCSPIPVTREEIDGIVVYHASA